MKWYLLPLALILAMAGLSDSAQAYEFGDNTVHWPGFESSYSSQNSDDLIGIPQLAGGEFSIDSGRLQGIRLDYAANDLTLWDTLAPGDWFLDLDSNGYWDVVLDSTLTADAGDWDVYSLNLAYADDGSYAFSQDVYTEPNTRPRMDHPVLAVFQEADLLGTSAFSGWETDPVKGDEYSSYWDLSSLDIALVDNSSLTYGFAMNCANDVLYGQTPVHTPEPGTLILLSAGGLGLAFGARRKRRAS
jgi:hypothetical protein